MNQALPWTPENVRKAKRRLGVTAYRPGQEALIDAVMQGRDALGILPTGGGKSLCYQLPALFLPHAVVVVSPLISLMKDQQDKLEGRAIPVAKLDSTLSARDERNTVDDIWEGEPELIYVTPERLEQEDSLAMLRRTGVSLMVVDEAHCVSQWGHDFRPAYLAIRRAVREIGRPPVLALTATATPAVAADILRQLDIPDAVVVNVGSYRENLMYEVRRTVNEAEKDERLMELLRGGPRDGPGLVYVATIREAVALFGRLKQAGVAAGLYHGKLSAKDRHRTQQAFMEDRYRLVVATKAFGLGIDKPNLRMVVHYSLPDSPESYVQETGRAGRDGKPAWAVLLYRLEDRRVQAYFLGGKYPRREDSAAAYRALLRAGETEGKPAGMSLKELTAATGLPQNKVKVIAALLESSGLIERGRRLKPVRRFADDEEFVRYLTEYEGRYQSDRDRLDAMMKYGQTTECRVRFLTRYFGHELPEDCGRCDNCRTGAAHRTVDVRELQTGTAIAV
ncbi:RecQ family ATP-dependent DNA helicase [Nitrospira moscoviensis]|uniref:ATP-dependent DNA helicase RecQ n=1 Tax=Nitrospira moscoviensis TaxID=42253 RepID=A0A0K2GEF2_NITMO|nr:RecQ family ATP-dependent DNA helicase [Nitrospira moscoviensis]ALA59239.1 ATP-dependent DNA helicase, RecQ family [Nitrospira moscoviensis]